MNEEEIKAAEVETNLQGGETVPAGRVPGAEHREQGPPACNLYRWYPPLLVLSTVMAGVFCVLYVTKPVFLEAPNQSLPDPRNVPVFAEQIASADVSPVRDSGKALMPVQLDPDLSAGPREPGTGAGDSAGLPPVAELEPMQVRRSSKPLFQPLNPEEMPPSAPPKAIALEPAPSEAVAEAAGSDREAGQAAAVAEPVGEGPGLEATGSSIGDAVAMASPEELEAVQEEIAEHPVGHPTDDPGDEFEGDLLVAETDEEQEAPDEEPARIVMRASVLGEFFSGDGTHQAGAGRPLGSTKVIALKEEP